MCMVQHHAHDSNIGALCNVHIAVGRCGGGVGGGNREIRENCGRWKRELKRKQNIVLIRKMIKSYMFIAQLL